jgi:hypothetical protein
MNIYSIYKATNIKNSKSYIGFDSHWPKRRSEHKSAAGTGRHSAKGSKWWNDGIVEVMLPESPKPSFVRGRLKKDSTDS